MESVATFNQNNKSKLFINIISIAVPVVVALLLALPNKLELGGWTKNLSHFIGLINSLTTLTLIFGLIFIKLKKFSFIE
ncbi:MAG: hypothetical protein WKF71_14620 [Pyrinomonadaceae bacterium]